MLAALVRWSFALALLMLASVVNVVLNTHADAAQVHLADVHEEQIGFTRGILEEVRFGVGSAPGFPGNWGLGGTAHHAGETFTITAMDDDAYDRATLAAGNASLTDGIDERIELSSAMFLNMRVDERFESELFSNSSFFVPPNGIDYAGSTITALSLHVDRLDISHGACGEIFDPCDSVYDIAYTLGIFGTRPVPEPSTFGLVTFGLILLGLSAWRRRRRTK